METVRVEIRGVTYNVLRFGSGVPVLLLHGFTGSNQAWQALLETSTGIEWIVPDLLGHGQTTAVQDPKRFAMDEQVADLAVLMDSFDLPRFACCGYSMGGRVAIAMAIKYANRISKLLLESTSPGIKTESERQERRERDNALADRIEAIGVESFIREWENIPLFASQKQLPLEVQQSQRQIRTQQSALGLANSLRGLGTGMQPSYWHLLGEIQAATLLITGSMDSKFTNIAERLEKSMPVAVHRIVAGAGHTVHLEAPNTFSRLAVDFLTSSDSD